MENIFEKAKTGARPSFTDFRETNRSCSLGLEFLLKNGTPKGISADGKPLYPVADDLSVFLIDYAGKEEDILPAKDGSKWLDKQLNHVIPRCSDLDRLVLLFHCKNFPIASAVPCMLNGGAGMNEFSGRYAELPEAVASQTTLSDMFGNAAQLHGVLSDFYSERYKDYRELLGAGISRELSRGVLPAGQYTEFFTRLTLFNLIKFIQFYDDDENPLMKPVINQMKIIFQLGFPKLYSLFKNGTLDAQEKLFADFLNSKQPGNLTYRRNSEKLEKEWQKKHIIINEDGTPLDGDKCWIKVKEYSGTDQTPHDAVGMSMGNLSSAKSIEPLVDLLISLGHCSPFELTTLFFESQIPFFVFRHIIRHRTMGIYDWKFIDDVYVPRVRENQGHQLAAGAQDKLARYTKAAYDKAQEQRAAVKGNEEETRYLLAPVNQYVQFAGRIDIHNLVHILNLRKHSAAQYETRMMAHTLQRIFSNWTPKIYDAFLANKKLDELQQPEAKKQVA
ncbi:MAG: FAD-dependent thymidylate synthase [Holosporales bacterium]|jgi:thymidylate synthase ThyX|nr:FAD-dependent thymidylate synthase [Holosporales bacterium]